MQCQAPPFTIPGFAPVSRPFWTGAAGGSAAAGDGALSSCAELLCGHFSVLVLLQVSISCTEIAVYGVPYVKLVAQARPSRKLAGETNVKLDSQCYTCLCACVQVSNCAISFAEQPWNKRPQTASNCGQLPQHPDGELHLCV